MQGKGEISTGKVVTIILAVLVFVVVLYLIFQANILAWFNQLPDYGQEERLVANVALPEDSVRIGILAGGSQIYLQGKITGLYFVPAMKGSRQSGNIYMNVPTSLSNLWGTGIEIGTVTGYKISINSGFLSPHMDFVSNLKYLKTVTLRDLKLLNNAYLDKDYNLIYKYNKDLDSDWDVIKLADQLTQAGESNIVGIGFSTWGSTYLQSSISWNFKTNKPAVRVDLVNVPYSSPKYSSSAEINADLQLTAANTIQPSHLALINKIADSKSPKELARNIRYALENKAFIRASPDYAPSFEQVNNLLYDFDSPPSFKPKEFSLSAGDSVTLSQVPIGWTLYPADLNGKLFIDGKGNYIQTDKDGKIIEIYSLVGTSGQETRVQADSIIATREVLAF